VELFQGGVAFPTLPEVALHPHQRIARAQIRPDSIARLTELASDSGKEDAELVLRHDASVPVGGTCATAYNLFQSRTFLGLQKPPPALIKMLPRTPDYPDRLDAPRRSDGHQSSAGAYE
jgi:hypothetical protein